MNDDNYDNLHYPNNNNENINYQDNNRKNYFSPNINTI